jgi:hypothetical protein
LISETVSIDGLDFLKEQFYPYYQVGIKDSEQVTKHRQTKAP